jgi:AcrR family transcriptional regulator
VPRPSRRTEVRATAARLIREHGYDAATMDLIADEVGLNKGTLYHYYPSKSSILYELLSDQIDATLKLMQEVPETGSVVERMRIFIRLQVSHVSTKHDELVVFFQEVPWIDRTLPQDQAADLHERIDQYRRFANRLVKEGVASGDFRKINARIVLNSITGILGYVPVWFTNNNKRGRDILVDELSEFVMRGILA